MSDESRNFWNSVSNGQPDVNGLITVDITKLTSSGGLNTNLHPDSSSYHASLFNQYLHQESRDFGVLGGIVLGLQGRLNTWAETSPTVLNLSHNLNLTGNIADEYRLQALEAGEHILEEVQKDAIQIFEKTNAIVSKKAQEFVVAHPELVGNVDESTNLTIKSRLGMGDLHQIRLNTKHDKINPIVTSHNIRQCCGFRYTLINAPTISSPTNGKIVLLLTINAVPATALENPVALIANQGIQNERV